MTGGVVVVGATALGGGDRADGLGPCGLIGRLEPPQAVSAAAHTGRATRQPRSFRGDGETWPFTRARGASVGPACRCRERRRLPRAVASPGRRASALDPASISPQV